MPNKHENGFTLLEVVLAMLIIGIISIPVLGLFSGSRQRYGRSTESTIAVNLAQQKMEEIVGEDLDTYEENPTIWMEFEDTPGHYYQVDITPPEAGSELDKDKLNLYTVDVRVQCQTGETSQNIALSTYLVDR